MAKWVVSAEIRLEVEDADTEEDAKVAAVEDLSDYFRYNTWPDLLVAKKIED